ncbi:MAG TPA: hypothetical protein VMG12_42230 [Polyangiaceae bacterium]|nr:hypothetical protein [Polyangiaceae bacterium]
MNGRLPRPASDDEKRQALARVLDSRALGRSEQLRNLFRYVCEAEIEGRGQELNEYVLGVSVLGRPAGYSPAEDSCVRSRAYELRNRLRVYYESEAPDDPIRIAIDKGGYCPRFERALPTLPPPAPGALRVASEPSLSTPELFALWGPLLDGKAPLLIAFDVRLFFFSPASGLVVRHYQANDPADAAHSAPLAAFRERMGEVELRETRDYADFGSVHAAFLLGRLLSGAPIDVGLKHSSSLDWQDVWNSHLVFIGKPNLNPIVRSMLDGKDFRADELGVVHNTRPLPGEVEQYHSASSHGMGEKYALITRARGPQRGRYVLLLTSAAAELMWALAESVTNPEHAAELLSHVRLPSGRYPEEFQIVIRATFASNVPVGIDYVTHHVTPSR